MNVAMASFSIPNQSPQFSEQLAWEGLKRAIAESSGFKSWKLERNDVETLPESSVDKLVHAYLRETLETLAY
jgi:hypothetical protein